MMGRKCYIYLFKRRRSYFLLMFIFILWATVQVMHLGTKGGKPRGLTEGDQDVLKENRKKVAWKQNVPIVEAVRKNIFWTDSQSRNIKSKLEMALKNKGRITSIKSTVSETASAWTTRSQSGNSYDSSTRSGNGNGISKNEKDESKMDYSQDLPTKTKTKKVSESDDQVDNIDSQNDRKDRIYELPHGNKSGGLEAELEGDNILTKGSLKGHKSFLLGNRSNEVDVQTFINEHIAHLWLGDGVRFGVNAELSDNVAQNNINGNGFVEDRDNVVVETPGVMHDREQQNKVEHVVNNDEYNRNGNNDGYKWQGQDLQNYGSFGENYQYKQEGRMYPLANYQMNDNKKAYPSGGHDQTAYGLSREYIQGNNWPNRWRQSSSDYQKVNLRKNIAGSSNLQTLQNGNIHGTDLLIDNGINLVDITYQNNNEHEGEPVVIGNLKPTSKNEVVSSPKTPEEKAAELLSWQNRLKEEAKRFENLDPVKISVVDRKNQQYFFRRSRTSQEALDKETNTSILLQFYNRYNQTQEVCSKERKTRLWGKVHGVLVTEKWKLAYCYVPKAGCTFWKRIFNFLNKHMSNTDLPSPFEISRTEVHKRFAPLTYKAFVQFSQSKQSLKFLFTREPYARLWSAYIDKFFLPDFWDSFRSKINLKRSHFGDVGCINDVTFEEFVNLTLKWEEPHWDPIYSICNPCKFVPDIIGKMETFTNDTRFILKQAGLKDILATFDSMDYVEMELDTLIQYNLALLKNAFTATCISKTELFERLWAVFQINGYLPETSYFNTTSVLCTSDFKDLVMSDYHSRPHVPGIIKKQHRKFMVKAYRALPTFLLHAVKKKYAMDFRMFGYNEEPKDIFN